MNSYALLDILSQIPFVAIFAITFIHALRRPRRATIDIALLFGAIVAIFVIGWITDEVEEAGSGPLDTVQVVLLTVLPYLLLRVVVDFIAAPSRLQRGAELLLGVLVVAIVLSGSNLPPWLVIGIATYFIALGMYSSWEFARGALRTPGVTSRRLYAASCGSILIGLVILVVASRALVPSLDTLSVELMTRLLIVSAGFSFFVAFSPPRLLRRAWQEPELRDLLSRVAILPRLPNMAMIVRALEDGAATTLGAPQASIGLWIAARQVLRFERDGQILEARSGEWLAGQVFATQRALFSENAPRDDPTHADDYRALGAVAVLAAPITAGERALGVIVVFAARPPIFADDDLQLLQLLADQAAIILESRSLIDEATLVQARAEATRLRDDFLVAAAHDLRTPLTAAIARAQFIQRRGKRHLDQPIDSADVQQIVDDLLRLKALMSELLDVTRAEHGPLLGRRRVVDLVDLVNECTQRHDWTLHRCVVDAPHPVDVEVDTVRIAQVIDNLLENAIKYSPEGGEVRVKIWRHDSTAHLSVSDSGIGIPPADLPHIFDRFHRGGNVETPGFAGMGLGLYICQSIIAQHGGRIMVDSIEGQGTTFEIVVPLDSSVNENPLLETRHAADF